MRQSPGRAAAVVALMMLSLSPTARGQQAAAPSRDEKPHENMPPMPPPVHLAPQPPPVQKVAPPMEIFRPFQMVDGFDGLKSITLDEPDPGDPVAEEGIDGLEGTSVHAPLINNEMIVAEENFELWLVGYEVDVKGRLRQLRDEAAAKIDRADPGRRLTGPQRQKLMLAASGDLKRLADRIEQERATFELQRRSFADGHGFLRSLKPLMVELRDGPFGAGSLFEKVLKTIEAKRNE